MRIARRLIVVVLIISVVAAFSLIGCKTTEEETTAEETTEEAKESLVIACVIPSTDSTYWGQYIVAGMENGAYDIREKYGIDVELTVYGPAGESETDKFVTILEDVISKKPDAIVVGNLLPDATKTLVQEAYDEGIFVNLVSLGFEGGEDTYASWYGFDIPGEGRQSGTAFIEAAEKKGIPLKGTVGVHMSVVIPVLEDMISGFRDVLEEEAPDVQVLETVYNENDLDKTQANVEAQIATYGDELLGFYGANNVSGSGIALAVANAGLGSTTVNVAQDSDEVEITALREGNLDALILLDPYQVGYLSVMNVYENMFLGKVDAKKVDIPFGVVTKENMDEEVIKGLLDPTSLKKE